MIGKELDWDGGFRTVELGWWPAPTKLELRCEHVEGSERTVEGDVIEGE